MSKILLRSCNTTTRCSRCPDGLYDIEVDGVVLCESCLIKAVRATSGDKSASPITAHEARLLESEITRLTGHAVRGLKCLPRDVIEDLRRVVCNVDQERASLKSKLRRYGLPS